MAGQPSEVVDGTAGAGSLRCRLPPGTRRALRLELRSLQTAMHPGHGIVPSGSRDGCSRNQTTCHDRTSLKAFCRILKHDRARCRRRSWRRAEIASCQRRATRSPPRGRAGLVLRSRGAEGNALLLACRRRARAHRTAHFNGLAQCRLAAGFAEQTAAIVRIVTELTSQVPSTDLQIATDSLQ